MRALETPGPDTDEIRRELAASVEDHRSALVNNPQESRDLLKVLIEDRLMVHPVDGEAEWELRGMGSLEALVVRAAQNLASLMPASWNQIAPWLRAVDELRRAA